jgi:hypothetical protein
MNHRLYTCIFFVLLLSSCTTEEKPTTEADITGNWLVVSSNPLYHDDEERESYLAVKDSIVGLRGLKLISIQPRGIFQQLDTTYGSPGSWLYNSRNQQFFVSNAGPGFTAFSGRVMGCRDDTMGIEERLNLPDASFTIEWHFKKITADSPAHYLFLPANNQWRIRSAQPEDEAAIKKKLSAMFHYYSLYFNLISREANYFSPKRILLPIRYYQHGVGMRDFDKIGNFKAIFNNDADARTAYELVEKAMKAEKRFPSGKDYVEEYARYFGKLEKAVVEQ